MTVKQYLRQIERLENIIDNKLAEIFQMRVLSQSISAVRTDTERVQTSGHIDPLGDCIARIEQLESRAAELVALYRERRSLIIQQLEGMDNPVYYNILFDRYVLRMNFEQIADKHSYSVRHVIRLHGDALVAFGGQYDIHSIAG